MKKTILEIYALAVCFLVVICFAITLGVAIYDVLKISHPSFTLSSWEYNKFQSNDNFCSSNGPAGTQNQCSNQSETSITNKREAAYAISLKGEQRNGLQSLVNSLIVLFINIVIFVPHWIIARKARM